MTVPFEINDRLKLKDKRIVEVVDVLTDSPPYRYKVLHHSTQAEITEDQVVGRVMRRGTVSPKVQNALDKLNLSTLIEMARVAADAALFPSKKAWDQSNQTKEELRPPSPGEPTLMLPLQHEAPESIVRCRLMRTQLENNELPGGQQTIGSTCIYHLEPLDDELKPDPRARRIKARGVLPFVVRMDSKAQIICGSTNDRHYPLAAGKPVCFAGQLYFDSVGHLLRWDNNTGHFHAHFGLWMQATEPVHPDDQKPILERRDFLCMRLHDGARKRFREALAAVSEQADSEQNALERALWKLYGFDDDPDVTYGMHFRNNSFTKEDMSSESEQREWEASGYALERTRTDADAFRELLRAYGLMDAIKYKKPKATTRRYNW